MLLVVAASAPAWGPPVLQRVDAFRVERVEVSGIRLVAPQEVLSASGIRAGDNVWDDAAKWEEALRRHPVLADAQVTRRLPGTLRVRVREKAPVALLDAGTLRPATAGGEILPVDPARVPVDLPIVRTRRAGEAARDSLARPLLAEIARLSGLDPELGARISEVRRAPGGELSLLLAQPAAELVVPAGAGARRLRELRAVLRELDRAAAAGRGRPLVDLRFEDQIVVRFPYPA